MYKTTLKYEDYLGNTQQETLRFNLTEGELRDLARHDKTFNPDILAKVQADEDTWAMYDTIRKLIAVSYGILSEDGKHFRKSEEITRDFLESRVYEVFIDSLIATDDVANIRDFIVGIFPAKYAEELAKRANASIAQPVLMSAT